MNHNSEPYGDPGLSAAARAADLLSRMTLEEKAGQMTLVEKNSIAPADVAALGIGGVLSGGGGSPQPNTPKAWAAMVRGFEEAALRSRLAIPLLYGADAVHGHSNVRGAVVFPHSIGLGASRDADLVERVARATAEELVASGVNWNYAPMVAVPQDIRWGRTYEGFGERTDLVSQLGVATIRGLQSTSEGLGFGWPGTVLATPKHFVGDGGTTWGTSTFFLQQQYMLDQGVTAADEATLRAVHLPPYAEAIRAGARCIMVSLSSWSGLKMHAQRYLLTGVLKGELGFPGFLVSDWQAVQQVASDLYTAIATCVNAGLDMVMVPYDYRPFIGELIRAVADGDVDIERIDDAVRRILTVKFELGLFEHPFGDDSQLAQVGSAARRQTAREAVRKSLVLLKDEAGVLPLSVDTPSIFVAGRAADDIGIQCGGWTVEWLGQPGPVTPGTTILQAIRAACSATAAVEYDPRGAFADRAGAVAVGIAVVGELLPYAEGVGDRADLSLSAEDRAAIQALRAHCERLVVILVSGRPMIVTDWLDQADALIAAWLPGTEGQGVADVLFGDAPFTGRLPYTWPRSMDQIPFDFSRLSASGPRSPLYPYGYGLGSDGAPLHKDEPGLQLF
jgi:beta-glucosidase